MLAEGRDYLLVRPRLALAPGLSIMVSVVAFNILAGRSQERADRGSAGAVGGAPPRGPGPGVAIRTERGSASRSAARASGWKRASGWAWSANRARVKARWPRRSCASTIGKPRRRGRSSSRGGTSSRSRGPRCAPSAGRPSPWFFQDPMTSLNPVLRVGDQVAEARDPVSLPARTGGRGGGGESPGPGLIAEPRAAGPQVSPRVLGRHAPRALIAMAVAASPRLLIGRRAHHPARTSRCRPRSSLFWIGHGRRRYGAAPHHPRPRHRGRARGADRGEYAGRIVESGPSGEVLGRPLHPYTEGLSRRLPHPSSKDRASSDPGLPARHLRSDPRLPVRPALLPP
jgi:hypothetical protein